MDKPTARIKPPLGLKPRYILDMQRLMEIEAAMQRYLYAQKQIPQEWFEEYTEIFNRLGPR